MISRKCKGCSDFFQCYESDKKAYCSKECKSNHMNVLKVCPICKNEFKIYRSRQDHQTYCSKECKEKGQFKEIECKECGKKVIHAISRIEQKGIKYHFCSNECYQKYKNKEKIYIQTKYLKICNNCGKEFESFRNKTKTGCFFCSQECSKEYQRGENHPSWNGGIAFNNGYKAIKIGDKYFLEHRIIMEKAIGRKLEKNEVVHHIDENKLNNDIYNLTIMDRKEHDRYHTVKRHKIEKLFGEKNE